MTSVRWWRYVHTEDPAALVLRSGRLRASSALSSVRRRSPKTDPKAHRIHRYGSELGKACGRFASMMA
jgi:hypothetical protein